MSLSGGGVAGAETSAGNLLAGAAQTASGQATAQAGNALNALSQFSYINPNDIYQANLPAQQDFLTNSLAQAEQQTQPYTSAGYGALNSLEGTLGISTPTAGWQNVMSAENAQLQNNAINQSNQDIISDLGQVNSAFPNWLLPTTQAANRAVIPQQTGLTTSGMAGYTSPPTTSAAFNPYGTTATQNASNVASSGGTGTSLVKPFDPTGAPLAATFNPAGSAQQKASSAAQSSPLNLSAPLSQYNANVTSPTGQQQTVQTNTGTDGLNLNDPTTEQSLLSHFLAGAPGLISSGVDQNGNPLSPSQRNQISQLYGALSQMGPIQQDQPLTAQQSQLVQQYQDGTLQMGVQPQSQVLGQYFNTPAYDLNFGNTGAAVDPNASPLQRFADSPQAALIGGYDPNASTLQNVTTNNPGYQFQMQQGNNAITTSAAASGLLNSGQFAKNIDTFSQGLANTDYQQYLNNLNNAYSNYSGLQNSTFTNYQTQLADLSGFGASYNPSNAILNTGTNQASVQGGYAANTAGVSNSFGQNAASVYSNLGTTQANATLAGANAQAQAQIGAANANAATSAGNASLGSALGSQVGPSLFSGTGLSSGASSGIASAAGGILGGLF